VNRGARKKKKKSLTVMTLEKTRQRATSTLLKSGFLSLRKVLNCLVPSEQELSQ